MTHLVTTELSATQHALAIHAIMQAAYQVEANLLDAADFFPLRRTVDDIRCSTNRFIGCHIAGKLAGVLEIEPQPDAPPLIASTVVSPTYFRQGVATALLQTVLQDPTLKQIEVSTAARNLPAIRLYQKHGFAIDSQTILPDGMELVRLRWQANGRTRSNQSP